MTMHANKCGMKTVTGAMLLGLLILSIVCTTVTAMDNDPGASHSRGAATAQWPMYQGNARRSGLSPYDTSHNNGTRLWSYDGKDFMTSPVTVGPDGTIYAGCNTSLLALDWKGAKKWSFKSEYIFNTAPAIGDDGTIYAGAFKNGDYGYKTILYAISPDGTLKWNLYFDTWGSPLTNPAIGDDGRIYLTTYDGKLHAIAANGTESWSFFDTINPGPIRASPSIGSDGTIYYATSPSDGVKYFYAINPDGGAKWKCPVSGVSFASPVIAENGTIYESTFNGDIYAFTPNLTLEWTYQTGLDLPTPPALGPDGSLVILGKGSETVPDTYLLTLDRNGALKWKLHFNHSMSEEIAVGADGSIFIYDEHGIGLMDFAPNGTLKWTYHGDGTNRGHAIGAHGIVYVPNGFYLDAVGSELLPPPKVPPTQPLNPVVDGARDHVNLTWAAPVSDGGSPITEYQVYREPSPKPDVPLAVVAAPMTTYTDTSVQPNSTYNYKVLAVSAGGISKASKQVTIILPPLPERPTPPTGLTARALGGTVKLGWTPPMNEGRTGILSYKIFRKGPASGDNWSQLSTGSLQNISFTDANVVRGSTYQYRITAVGEAGESDPSSEITATVPKPSDGTPEFVKAIKPVHIVASITVSLVVIGLCISLTEVGRFSFFTFIAPLYSRLHKEEVLDNFLRGQLFGHINENPGLSFSELKRKLARPNGTVAYHLMALERDGLVKSYRHGSHRVFFPSKMKVPKEFFDFTDPERVIYKTIETRPGLSQKEIAKETGMSSAKINRNVRSLEGRGLITVQRDGKRAECFIKEQGEA